MGGPDLVHVDAYRVGGLAELDDLDLDATLDDSVTVVEWGEGLAEHLGVDVIGVRIERDDGDGAVRCLRRPPRHGVVAGTCGLMVRRSVQ